MRKNIYLGSICLISSIIISSCAGVSASKVEPNATQAGGPDPVSVEAPSSSESSVNQTFLEREGIQVNLASHGTFMTQMLSDDLSQDLGEVEIDFAILELEESIYPYDDNYKIVTFSYGEDASKANDHIIGDYFSAFDAYTGYSFEKDGKTIMTYGGERFSNENAAIIQFQGKEYDVHMYKEVFNNWPTVINTITIICPKEYDGAVFQFGPSNADMDRRQAEIDFREKLNAINELPHYGEGFKYYRYETQQSTQN